MAAEDPMDWLRMISDETVEEGERLQASHNLSSFLAAPFPDATKESMKSEALTLLLKTTCPQMQGKFLDIMMVVAELDFPHAWNLLPSITASLGDAMESNDIHKVILILRLCVLLFESRYNGDDIGRAGFRAYCIDFATPLEIAISKLWSKLTHATSSEEIWLIVRAQQLCCNIVSTFTYQNLPEFFSLEFGSLMAHFWEYLMCGEVLSLFLHDLSVLEAINLLYAAVCGILNRYVDRNELAFSVEYAPHFAKKVVELITKSFDLSPDCFVFQISGLEFLASLARSDRLRSSFSDQKFRTKLYSKVVGPCLKYSIRDKELFFKSYKGYISGQTASNGTSRRMRACNLLTSLSAHHMGEIQRLFNSFLQSKTKKECAFFMSMYLDDDVMSNIISTEDLFSQHIRPLLRDGDPSSGTMIKASALEAFIDCRQSIPRDIGLPALLDLGTMLQSDSKVVQSYAALGIQLLLDVKDQEQPRYTSLDLSPYLDDLYGKLSIAMDGSTKNRFLSSCRSFIFDF